MKKQPFSAVSGTPPTCQALGSTEMLAPRTRRVRAPARRHFRGPAFGSLVSVPPSRGATAAEEIAGMALSLLQSQD